MAFFFELDFSTTRTFDGFGLAVRAEAAVAVFVGGLDLGFAGVLAVGSALTALADLDLSASTSLVSVRPRDGFDASLVAGVFVGALAGVAAFFAGAAAFAAGAFLAGAAFAGAAAFFAGAAAGFLAWETLAGAAAFLAGAATTTSYLTGVTSGDFTAALDLPFAGAGAFTAVPFAGAVAATDFPFAGVGTLFFGAASSFFTGDASAFFGVDRFFGSGDLDFGLAGVVFFFGSGDFFRELADRGVTAFLSEDFGVAAFFGLAACLPPFGGVAIYSRTISTSASTGA
jgi:hypothetical protein